MGSEFVRVEIDGAVATVFIDRPKALNALNQQVLRELDAALTQLDQTPALRAAIITGGGEKAFVAGADIAEMSAFTLEQAKAFAEHGHAVFTRIESLKIPVIAAVNGFALGGGCELMLACDMAYASEKAKLGLPEVTLSVIPGFGGTQRLTRLVGRQRAKELIFTGNMIDAARAKEFGLVLDVVPADKLMAHCLEVAQTIAKRGPLAVTQAKKAIDAGADLELHRGNALERQGFANLFGSADQREGMAAFLAKRAPAFTGQ